MRPVKPLLAALLAAALALVAASAATAQEDKVVLTVGLTNDWDSLNPVVGQEVPDYEVWILQYGTVTNKAADDFATIPGLAESWEASNDGKTYTYTLREGLKWSDGQPLTAKDVAFTINRANKEEWLNFDAFVGNLRAKAIDERTVEVTSSAPDPRLPGLGDTYILPEHIWGELDEKEITKYEATDGVGSGPFTIAEWKRGQYVRMKANPNYWGGQRPIDEVIFRLFNNADAMVAALKNGELDAAQYVPNNAMTALGSTEGIVAVQGHQGGFDELAINGGAGLKKPHPALLDRKVRLAIAHAIDRQTLVDKVLVGLGEPLEVISPGARREWIPELSEEESFEFDLAKAKGILEAAGYKDTNGDGIREMPGGGDPLNFTYAVRTESQVGNPVAEFVTGWLKEIGIGTTLKPMNDSKLIEVIGKGEYDMFHWSWTPFVDPDPMLSYFTCDQVSSDPEDPTNYYNDANWCDKAYDALYKQQRVELDEEKRIEIVHRMLRRFHDAVVYHVLWLEPDLQAYRTDRFEGWVRQPAEVGPVIFSNSSPTYASLTPVAGRGGGDDGIGTGAIVGIVIGGAVLIGLAAWFVLRRRTAEERE